MKVATIYQTELSEADFALVAGFFQPILNGPKPLGLLIRTGVGVFGSTPTLRTIFKYPNSTFAVHVQHRLFSITRLKDWELEHATKTYRRLVDEIQDFLIYSLQERDRRKCPICGREALTMFLHFSTDWAELMSIGCEEVLQPERRRLVQADRFTFSRPCPMHYDRHNTTYPLFHLDYRYEEGRGQSTLRTHANFFLGVVDCVKKSEVG